MPWICSHVNGPCLGRMHVCQDIKSMSEERAFGEKSARQQAEHSALRNNTIIR
jgi:hypothetical protein